jgi:hypothetical protein
MATITPRRRNNSVQSPIDPPSASKESNTKLLTAVQKRVRADFYPKLVLYGRLARYAGPHIRRQDSKNHRHELCRNFLDAFAYLCDIRRGGEFVTAAAIRQCAPNHELWLAANAGIAADVKDYAETILKHLKKVNNINQGSKLDEIFNLAVHKTAPRLLEYKNQMQNYALQCRVQLQVKIQTKESKIGRYITVHTLYNADSRRSNSHLRST